MLAPTLWSQRWTPGFEGSVFARVRACGRVWRCVSLGHAMEVFSHSAEDDNVTAQSLPQTSCCYCVRWCTLMTKTCVSGVFFFKCSLIDLKHDGHISEQLAAALMYSLLWINIIYRATHMLRIFQMKKRQIGENFADPKLLNFIFLYAQFVIVSRWQDLRNVFPTWFA